jgi:hypothetical protein
MKINRLSLLTLTVVGIQFIVFTSAPAQATPLDLWLSTELGGQVSLTDVTFGNGLFVAVGNGIYTSTDGAHWISRGPNLGRDAAFDVVGYGANGFVAAGYADFDLPPLLWTSPDGTNWTSRDGQALKLAWQTRFSNLVYGNGQYVVTLYDGTGWIATNVVALSTNGVDWTLHPMDYDSYRNHSLAYGNGIFVLAASSGTRTSTDGLNWTPPQYIYDGVQIVTCGAGRFVASGDHMQLASTDGVNWAQTPLPTTLQYPQALTYGDGLYVAFAFATAVVLHSTNGLDWVVHTANLPTNAHAFALTFGNGVFVAVGANWNGLDYDLTLLRSMLGLHLELQCHPTPQLAICGLVPGTCRIESKDSLGPLSQWSALETFAFTNSPATWTDTSAGAGAQRFYRAVWNP